MCHFTTAETKSNFYFVSLFQELSGSSYFCVQVVSINIRGQTNFFYINYFLFLAGFLFLAQKKGICFDYAALMTAMLRSQDIPTKLVVGYTGSLYHAWINVFLEGQGWVDNVIYFDGHDWKLMDPTFASSGKQSKEIMQYIGNGGNYKAKYSY